MMLSDSNTNSLPAGCMLASFFFAVLLAGCGGEPTGAVRGLVTFEGAPVTFGTVAVVSDREGAVRQAMIVDGEYQIEDLPIGRARFAVTAHAPPRTVHPPDASGAASPVPQIADIPPLPARYTDVNHSGLTFEVVAGEQTHDLKLSKTPMGKQPEVKDSSGKG